VCGVEKGLCKGDSYRLSTARKIFPDYGEMTAFVPHYYSGAGAAVMPKTNF
jgi:hypothetical protein